MIGGFDHIGIAVKDLNSAVQKFEAAFSITCSGIEVIELQKVRVAFFRVGDSRIELLEATSSDSPIHRFIEKRGEGIHHIALKSSGLKDDLSNAQNAGCQIVETSSSGAHGSEVAFLHPKSLCGVLIEICKSSGKI